MKETGKLIIITAKKGFVGKIVFNKKDGKTAELPIQSVPFQDASLNGKECEFERDSGKLISLVVDGKVLFPFEIKQKEKKNEVVWDRNQSQQGNADNVEDSLKINSTYLPKDTREVLSSMNVSGPLQRKVIENFALKFHKLARFDERREVFTFFKRERRGENYQIQTDFEHFPFANLARRQVENAKKQFLENHFSEMKLQTDWRIALGLGYESVYETSITLHHIYGIPYIPASAIKGVMRSWIITNCFAKEGDKPFEGAEDRALKNNLFKYIFGGSSDDPSQGNIIFFDAFPTTAPKIEPDVMNPHYQPYYSESPSNAKTPPADYHNPVPIFFLTVKDARFQFIIGIKQQCKLKEMNGYSEEILKRITHSSIANTSPIEELKPITKDSTLLDLASLWLKFALTEHGIGAKTAVGYGYMK